MNDDVTMRVAGEDENSSLLELWTTVFDADASVFTCEYDSFPPEHRKTFVAEADGGLVGSVQLFGLPIRDEWNAPIMIGAIANVCTRPEFRSLKIASRLLELASAEMQARSYAWSFLFTHRHSFYEQLGWRTIHRSFLELQVQAANLPDATSDVVLQVNPDLKKFRALCEASFETPLSRIRSDLDWQVRIPVRIAGKAVFMSDTAYAIVRESGADAVLEEWGMAEVSIDGFQSLLLAVAPWAASKGIQNLIVSAPILAEARQALETLFPNMRNIEESEAMVRPLSEDWSMVRLISLFNLPDARFFKMDNF